MPFSSTSGKLYIRRIVESLNPIRVLDVGAGCGTYSNLFRRPDQYWTGIEIWEPYIQQYRLRDRYDALIVADIRTWQPNSKWDLAFAGDVLEHMTADEARAVLNKLRACAKTVIVSLPIGYYPQDEYAGNPYERHVVDNWSDEEVRSKLGEPTCSLIDNEIGVYVYSEPKVKPMKIAVYAIAKNEAHFIKRFVESAKAADYIVFADTGSTDSTLNTVKEIEAQYRNFKFHQIWVKPWRFDLARNAVLALIPPDVDVCISLDVDEVLVEGWREEIEKVWKLGETTQLRYGFDWGHDIIFQYEKIHSRWGYRWHHPCHEYPVCDLRQPVVWAETRKLLVKHLPDPTKSRGQYLELLELSVKEDPKCPRNAFYYARELTFHKRWADAAIAFKKYLDMPEATWINERCYAMRLLGKCYDELGSYWEGLTWYRRACAEAPNTREPWVDLALACYIRSNHEPIRWVECYAAAKQALAITNRERVYTCDPEVWGSKPHDLLALAAYQLGLYDEAVTHGEKAVELSPNDKRLQNNLMFYRQKATTVVEIIDPPKPETKVETKKENVTDLEPVTLKPKPKAKPRAKSKK